MADRVLKFYRRVKKKADFNVVAIMRNAEGKWLFLNDLFGDKPPRLFDSEEALMAVASEQGELELKSQFGEDDFRQFEHGDDLA